jgi:hypothetical protein
MRKSIDLCGGIGIVWLDGWRFGGDGEEQWDWDL